MSSVSNTSSVSSNNFFTTSQTTTANSSISYQDYLNLLSAELQYQDPTNPVSSTDTITQTAQLQSLSNMNNLYSGVSNMAAFGLIGKTVEYQTTDSTGATTTASGTVSSVNSSNGTTYLNVSGTPVTLDKIVAVASSTSAGTSGSASDS